MDYQQMAYTYYLEQAGIAEEQEEEQEEDRVEIDFTYHPSFRSFREEPEEEPVHIDSSELFDPVHYDRRSYAANSDLFYRNIEPIVEGQLPPEEFKRQSEYYKMRFGR